MATTKEETERRADNLKELRQEVSEVHRWARGTPERDDAISDALESIYTILEDIYY